MSTNDAAALQDAATIADATLSKHWATDARGNRYSYWRCERCGDECTSRRALIRECGCYR